jgi:precorrin-2 dehydrogenase/sirohydrochlorin ferrochelatase
MAVALTAPRHYPVFLDLAGQPVVVVGGGPVAERKVEGLVDTGAAVTVISPALTQRLRELVSKAVVEHVARPYTWGDVSGARLAFVATDDADVNAAVAQEARARGVWVNAADDRPHCDFILPAVVRRGRLTVAVGTGGASPALAAVMRDEVAATLPEECEALLDLAADVRAELLGRSRHVSADVWHRALSDRQVRALVASNDLREARRALLERLGESSCT